MAGDEVSEYHVQAAIAATHARAADPQSRDWPMILDLYDQLLALNGSPVVALNRAVAVAKVRGPAEGWPRWSRWRTIRSCAAIICCSPCAGTCCWNSAGKPKPQRAFAPRWSPSAVPVLRALYQSERRACSEMFAAPQTGCLASLVRDLGAPLDKSTTVKAGAAESGKTAITGYSLLQAASMEEAVSLMKDHPHFRGPGATVQILECVPMPGM
jgi:hypothetical protein